MSELQASTLFFLHLPKTAGTTLNRILEANFDPEAVLSVYSREELDHFQKLTTDELKRIRVIQGHMLVIDYKALLHNPELNVFTFLRHPVDRLLSEYFFLKNWPNHHLYHFLNRHDVGLEEYVTSRCKELVYRGKNFITRILSGMSFGPLENCQEALFTALDHLNRRFLMFGVMERFNESLLLLKRLAGLESVCYELHNVHVKRPGREQVGPDLIEVIEEHNQLDMELYSLALEHFDRRIQTLGPGFAQEVQTFAFVNAKYQRIAALLTPPGPSEKGRFMNSK